MFDQDDHLDLVLRWGAVLCMVVALLVGAVRALDKEAAIMRAKTDAIVKALEAK
jgi:hypothetical protein